MLFVVSIASLLVHYLVSKELDVFLLWEQTDYSLVGMYTFGITVSLFIVVFTLLTQFALPKNLGFVFLGLMTIYAIASYVYIKDGLNKFDNDFLEYNFLVVFFVFLIFNVFVAFKAINQENRGV